MRNRLGKVAISLSFILVAEPAGACMMMAGLKIDDIEYASVVVIGKIVNYEIVRPKDEISEFWRRTYGLKDVLSDYARFNVSVEEVLVGQPPEVLTVTWDNSTFGEPKTMKEGSYLIGLRDPRAARPPLRGPSATVLPSREPNALTVLQAPCAPAFIFEASSPEATTIKTKLRAGPK
jgi:hypothetical protein